MRVCPPRPLPRIGAQAQLHIVAAERQGQSMTMLSGSPISAPPSFSNRRRRCTHNHPFGVSVSHSASQSVFSPSGLTVWQSERRGKEGGGRRRRGREGRARSISQGTKGRRMMTPSRLGSEQPTMQRAGEGKSAGRRARGAAHLWTDPILRSRGGTPAEDTYRR